MIRSTLKTRLQLIGCVHIKLITLNSDNKDMKKYPIAYYQLFGNQHHPCVTIITNNLMAEFDAEL